MSLEYQYQAGTLHLPYYSDMGLEWEIEFAKMDEALMGRKPDVVSELLDEGGRIVQHDDALLKSVTNNLDTVCETIKQAGGRGSDGGKLVLKRIVDLATTKETKTNITLAILNNFQD